MVSLDIGRYRFRWIAQERARMPVFLGPTLRGGLGHVLRRLVCVTRQPECSTCLLRFRCAYPTLFEPYAPPGTPFAARYARMPVPFVIRAPLQREPARSLEPGQPLEFELLLVGRANLDLPYYLLALVDLGKRGIGPRRHRFHLQEAAAWTPDGFVPVYSDGEGIVRTDVPPTPVGQQAALLPETGRLVVRFVTPARLDLNGDLVYPVEFIHLTRALLERRRALLTCYGGTTAPGEVELIERATAVRRAEDRTCWVELSRYSTRQRTSMRIGGAAGTVAYEGEDFRLFADLLGFGEWLHVGKLATMGFGQMEVVRG
jgi:hypothetical protein